MFATISSIAFVLLLITGFAAWVGVVVYGYKTTRELSPGRSWSEVPYGRLNRFNVLFHPQLLTEKGKQYRRKTLQSLLLFAASILLGFLVGSLLAFVK